jgi:alkylated DNA repair protein (DNA oxidative demethylase)
MGIEQRSEKLVMKVPIVLGIEASQDFVSLAEEVRLIKQVDAADLSPFKFQRWTGKRLTRSFGWSYDFENGGFAPADAFPIWLEPIKTRAARHFDLDPKDLVQALLIRYDPGAGIGWHRDRPVFEHVLGISLGTHAVLRVRQRTATGFNRAKIELAPRSIYHLSGEGRHQWEHGIAPMDEPRWSITFRSLSTRGRRT